MKLSEELQQRGFIYQSSSEDLVEMLDNHKRTVYLGIDPTADSIHVGNLVPYMLLNHLRKAGHKVILLIGGGTGLIGDPGGKSEERPFVSVEQVKKQAEAMQQGVSKFVPQDVLFVNNYTWLSKLSMMEYLRDVGKHFTINAMIKKDIVANRLGSENPISYTEFSYSLLQAYDYHYLHTEYGCDLQIGGSDQWSNMLAGVDYIRRTENHEVFTLTMPLIVDKNTGKKFGKSEGNAIWLNPEKTSPYEFYQFWLHTADESVIDYLKIFTNLTLGEIEEIQISFQREPESRTAQKILAEQVTQFVHGNDITEQIKKVTTFLFGGEDASVLTQSEKDILLINAPTSLLVTKTSLVEIVLQTNLATSKREARMFIESGSIMVNRKKIIDIEYTLTEENFINSICLLQRGKKKIHILTQ